MSQTPSEDAAARGWFRFGLLFEILLAGAAVLLAKLGHIPLLAALRWSPVDAANGIVGIIPLLLLLAATVSARIPALQRIVHFMDTGLRPIMGRWSLLQLGCISVAAGIGEELLFRGVIQSWLAHRYGTWTGLVVTSAVFGGFHCVTRAYGVLAALMGIYMGVLWLWSGNLLVPILAHALYDFVALIYFFRVRRPP